ncbi:cysteine proteinase [Piedraia hortae CBS 480.64]|uniref:ubiquitinyl hydrolase 1 n=1 Tax=Piedraia hortae CBS 480.64 TaxID=1314780 RepID=A0A6A7BY01_9PEZI|nr:cysteine proteinase [Piedraia hortae CBS 480.64]
MTGPGKLPPLLVEQIFQFDPANSGIKPILTEHPPPEGSTAASPPANACTHEYTLKATQSVLQPDLSVNTKVKAALVCKFCRVHVDVEVQNGNKSRSCPNSIASLHHFVPLKHKISRPEHVVFQWRCSLADCGAQLLIAYRKPRLSESDRLLLVSQDLLESRFQETKYRGEDIRKVTPLEVLTRLHTYIRDALNSNSTRRTIQPHNKRFMEAFGESGRDCAELLTRLGFKDGGDGSWSLPDPPYFHRSLGQANTLREYLEDVQMEVQSWRSQFTTTDWPPAEPQLHRVLGIPDYAPVFRDNAGIKAQAHSLGALPDFPDAWISFAYDCQTNTDPNNKAYYMECLKNISLARDSVDLQTKFSLLSSQGNLTCGELLEVCKELNIFPRLVASGASDVQILNEIRRGQKFDNTHTDAWTHTLEGLHLLGKHINSNVMIRVSETPVNTYESALQWLGAETCTDDVILKVLHDDKVHADVTNGLTADAALATIRHHRATANADRMLPRDRQAPENHDQPAMSIEEACSVIGMGVNINDVNPEVLGTLIDQKLFDTNHPKADMALATLRAHFGFDEPNALPKVSEPVGLESYGNTCYLNSILQYYFSISGIRNVVLEYDDYKLLPGPDGKFIKECRVGQRNIESDEIQGGQLFAATLQRLFWRMIKTFGPTTIAEKELVERAFLDPRYYALLDRGQVAKPAAPSSSDGTAVASDQGSEAGKEPQSKDKDEDTKMADAPAECAEAVLAPDGTLLNVVANAVESQTEEKPCGRPPSKSPPLKRLNNGKLKSSETVGRDSSADAMEISTQVESPKTPSDNANDAIQGNGMEIDEAKPSQVAEPAKPHEETATTTKPEAALKVSDEEIRTAVEKVAREQHDAVEVHDNIMMRLRAGLKPQGHDSSNEQVDVLSKLYTIGMTETTTDASGFPLGGVTGKDTEDSSIQLSVPQKDTQLNTLLDDYFALGSRLQQEKESYFFKTMRDPPSLLQINIPHNSYNKEEQRTFKVEYQVRLEDEIYLDRFLDRKSDDADIKTRRQAFWKLRAEVVKMEHERDWIARGYAKGARSVGNSTTGPSALTHTTDYLRGLSDVNNLLGEAGLESLDDPDGLAEELAKEGESSSKRLSDLETSLAEKQQALQQFFEDDKFKTVKYRLAVVFVHSGGSAGGHYFTFIRDFGRNIWRKYNDGNVNKVPPHDVEESIFKHTRRYGGGLRGTPTFVVYVPDEAKQEIVQPVCREPELADERQPRSMHRDETKWDNAQHHRAQLPTPEGRW